MRPTFLALVAVLIAGAGCGREPTDPSRTNIAGIWQSFERPEKDLLRGIIRSESQNFHVTFTR